jgi:hypothetical protein
VVSHCKISGEFGGIISVQRDSAGRGDSAVSEVLGMNSQFSLEKFEKSWKAAG